MYEYHWRHRISNRRRLLDRQEKFKFKFKNEYIRYFSIVHQKDKLIKEVIRNGT